MIGSLATLKSNLEKNDIHDFKSLKEVLSFKNSYPSLRSQLISTHEKLVEEERNLLITDLQQLETNIEKEKHQAEQKLTVEIDNLKQKITFLTSEEPANLFQD